MGFLSDIFHILDQPIVNALALLYEYIPGQDFGVAVIVLTLLLRIILYPLSAKALESQKAQGRIQGKVREIQEQYKGKRDEISRRLLQLYKEEKINPFAAILPLVPQIFVFISLFTVLRGFEGDHASFLYPFVPDPGPISPSFLGLMDLDKKFLPLALAAGLSQLIQSKQMLALNPSKGKKDMALSIQTQMVYAFPLLTVFIGATLPSALSLYWTVSNLFSIAQQWYLMRKSDPRNLKSKTP